LLLCGGVNDDSCALAELPALSVMLHSGPFLQGLSVVASITWQQVGSVIEASLMQLLFGAVD